MIFLTIACKPMLEVSTASPSQLLSNWNTSLQSVVSSTFALAAVPNSSANIKPTGLSISFFLRGWTVRVCPGTQREPRTSKHVPDFVVRVRTCVEINEPLEPFPSYRRRLGIRLGILLDRHSQPLHSHPRSSSNLVLFLSSGCFASRNKH